MIYVASSLFSTLLYELSVSRIKKLQHYKKILDSMRFRAFHSGFSIEYFWRESTYCFTIPFSLCFSVKNFIRFNKLDLSSESGGSERILIGYNWPLITSRSAWISCFWRQDICLNPFQTGNIPLCGFTDYFTAHGVLKRHFFKIFCQF